MHPILFTIASFTIGKLTIGPFPIHTYGIMLAISLLVCTYFLSLDAKRYHISQDTAYDLVFWCMLWGIIGARIFYVLISWSYFSDNYLEILMLWNGGLAWQGGFLGGAIAGIWFARHRKLPLRLLLDLSAPYVALGQSIGRIGCFFNGCCYGKPVAWGVYFPTHNARLYPTQLFETAGLFIIFVILKKAQAKPHQAGFIFILYLWLAAIERFIVEFYRGDTIPSWLGLTLAQYVALGVFTAGLFLVPLFMSKRAKGSPNEP